MIKTQNELRAAFWESHPSFSRKMVAVGRSAKTGRILYRRAEQNDYCADIRYAWVDFVDMMHRDGQISDELANRATL